MDAYRVLVADDDDFIHALLKISLRKTDYVVNFVKNGLEAIENIQTVRPDILITDGMMPVVTGFELIITLRSRADTAAMPIILLTGSSDLQSGRTSATAAADVVLSKPFKLGTMIASLKQAEELIRERAAAPQRFIGGFETIGHRGLS